ncbi:hypothetical protein DNX69_07700 [Rhodopseudomonas palustris]|uniref:Uncharacterized protein n=1 Tax=Rhodopseudomonas palustris TaxID=1076 RepID=A0A323UJ88_RHOPL|nr:hypothetical protein DNX69_07700 [Rhodopseudomonas palustris]
MERRWSADKLPASFPSAEARVRTAYGGRPPPEVGAMSKPDLHGMATPDLVALFAKVTVE